METNEALCAVCVIPCNQKCVKCCQVHYCSKEHQKADWKEHRASCYPVKIQVLSSGSRSRGLLATRDIAQGEIIFKEKPLLSGPRVQDEYLMPVGGDPDKFPICLECNRIIQGNYTCTKCFWPLCGPSCQQGNNHSSFECRIFAAHNVHPIKEYDVQHYLSICVLRGLLLQAVYPKKWKEFQELDSKQKEIEESSGPFNIVSGFIIEFIQDECKQTQFDVEEISFVAGALQVNRMGNEECASINHRFGSYLYHKASFASHSCVPNAMWFIQANQDIKLRASVTIKSRQLITASCVELGEGTFTRRSKLKLLYVNCECQRCKDPTELATYMSAVKCKDPNCVDGYYLMQNPLEEGESLWKCNNQQCGKLEISRNIAILVAKVQDEYNSIHSEWKLKSNPNELKNHIELLKKEEKFLRKNDGKTLHKNHAILFRCKLEMGHRIPHVAIHIEKEVDRMELEEKQVAWVRGCLDLANIFWPGYSRYRGQLMYTLQRGLFCLIFTEIENLERSRRGLAYLQPRVLKLRQAFQEVLKMRKEVKAILEIELEGKVEHEYAMEMDSEAEDFEKVRQVLGMP